VARLSATASSVALPADAEPPSPGSSSTLTVHAGRHADSRAATTRAPRISPARPRAAAHSGAPQANLAAIERHIVGAGKLAVLLHMFGFVAVQAPR